MSTLAEAIGGIEDPRSKHGRRHSLSAIITLILSGLLCGQTSLNGIGRWGRMQTEKTWVAMGFTRRPPGAPTLCTLLQELDIEALQQKLQGWLKGMTETGHHLALDGKTLRSSGETKSDCLHLLSLFCTRANLVVKDTDMREGENEITAALRLLKETDLSGKVVTGDAIFCQKNSAR